MDAALSYLHVGDWMLIGFTVLLILLPSQVPAAGNALGRLIDRLQGKTPP